MVTKKITINADGSAATIATASLGDVITTAIDPDVVLTGTYKYVQLGAFFVAGMATQEYRRFGSMNPFASR